MKVKLYKKLANLKNGDLLLVKDKETNEFSIVEYMKVSFQGGCTSEVIFFIGNEIEENLNNNTRFEKIGIVKITER